MQPRHDHIEAPLSRGSHVPNIASNVTLLGCDAGRQHENSGQLEDDLCALGAGQSATGTQ